jgi:hypothetical protein
MRIEISSNSPLPTKLTQAGYAPRHVSTGTRIVSGNFTPVDIVEMTLPEK